MRSGPLRQADVLRRLQAQYEARLKRIEQNNTALTARTVRSCPPKICLRTPLATHTQDITRLDGLFSEDAAPALKSAIQRRARLALAHGTYKKQPSLS